MQKLIIGICILLLLYTRFVGLNWGLPYPMHPDERNMADAVTRLTCPDGIINAVTSGNVDECMNPGFFAYGQAPLYIAYFLIFVWHVVLKIWGITLASGIGPSYVEATIALRIISALSSVGLVFVMLRIFQLTLHRPMNHLEKVVGLLLFTFQPYLIQFSHFGTTESLLMLAYMTLVLISLHAISHKMTWRHIIFMGIVLGAAVGIKTSALSFAFVPVIAVMYKVLKSSDRWYKKVQLFVRNMVFLSITSVYAAIITSPQSFLSWQLFLGSMSYEIPVGNGIIKVFYTRQFDDTIPYLFQFTHIFPYTLGVGVLILGILGFFILSWRNPQYNLLRFSWIIYFLPVAALYAKWTRFMAPIMPLMTLLTLIIFVNIWKLKHHIAMIIAMIFLLILMLIPGIAYVSIYNHEDVRFTATRHIVKKIPANAHILEEEGNVINIPVVLPNEILPAYSLRTFNFYDLDSRQKYSELHRILSKSDYVIVPSRRIFADHTCLIVWQFLRDCENLRSHYPFIYEYYEELLSDDFGLTLKVTSYPRIQILGHTLLSFPDELAEETWTVFDHPVVRVYSRLQ